jgi:hypothetical protein
MRKLVLSLVATSAIAGAASQASADVRSGFYVGADVSANALLHKQGMYYSVTGSATGVSDYVSQGNFGMGAGVYAGYGMVICNYYYVAGEVAYDYNSAKTKHFYNAVGFVFPTPTTTSATSFVTRVKNQNVFNFAFLAGIKITPSTVLYARLGGNVNDVKMTANMFGVSLSKSKTNVSFVPGIGMETTFTKNWVGRIEGTYDLGYKVSASKNITTTIPAALVPARTTTEKFTASSGKVANLAVKLGIAYKI